MSCKALPLSAQKSPGPLPKVPTGLSLAAAFDTTLAEKTVDVERVTMAKQQSSGIVDNFGGHQSDFRTFLQFFRNTKGAPIFDRRKGHHKHSAWDSDNFVIFHPGPRWHVRGCR